MNTAQIEKWKKRDSGATRTRARLAENRFGADAICAKGKWNELGPVVCQADAPDAP